MLIWIGLLIGLITAGVSASKSIFTKLATENTDSLTVALFSRAGGFVLLLPIALLVSDGVSTQEDVLVAVFLGGGILAFTSYLVTLSLEKADLSIVSPLLSFVPVAVVFPSSILVGETPTPVAGVGILLISVGSYLLNIGEKSDGLLKPITSIINNRGPQYVILAVVLFSVVPSLNKLALQEVSPIVLTSLQLPVSAFVLSVIGIKRLPDVRNQVSGNWKPLIGMAVATAALFVAQLTGYQYTQVSYIQSIKQVKVLISVAAGYYIFGEGDMKGRFTGAIVMVIGASLVILSS